MSVDVLRWEGLLEGEELAHLALEPARDAFERAKDYVQLNQLEAIGHFTRSYGRPDEHPN